MNTTDLREHLHALGARLSVTAAGKLRVEAPAGTLTDEVMALLAAHRDELIAAMPPPLNWPPPEPAWFAKWMREDDARRIATLAAALQRKTDSHIRRGKP